MMNPVTRLGAGLLCLLLTHQQYAQMVVPQNDYSQNDEFFVQAGFRYPTTSAFSIEGPYVNDVKARRYPVVQLGFRRFFREKFSWSVAAFYRNEYTRLTTRASMFERHILGVQSGFQWYWLRRNRLILYSGISGRIALERESQSGQATESSVYLRSVFTPAGFRFGNRYGVYGELTFADTGHYTMGFFYKMP